MLPEKSSTKLRTRNFCFRLALALTALLVAIQACALPFFAAPPQQIAPDPSQVAQLITLALRQTDQQETNARLTVEAVPPSATPEPPTETPTPTTTETPTPTATWIPALTLPPTETPFGTPPGAPTAPGAPPPGTGAYPKIYAEIDSNCRSGPSRDFKRLGYLLVGETSEVIGRNNSRTWWYIKEPRRIGILCWVWGGSTRVEGDVSGVPVIYIPTPTPAKKTPSASGTVSFYIVGVKVILCGGGQTVMIKLKNNGKKTFESAWLRVYDSTKSKILSGPSSSDAPFRSSDQDCSAGGNRLDPGKSGFIGAGLGGNNVSDHTIVVNVQLCTEEGLSGQCDSDTASYKVP